MEKRSYIIISLECYMQDLCPLEIYEELGIRPSECKLSGQKPLILAYKDWKKTLKNYELAHKQHKYSHQSSKKHIHNAENSIDSKSKDQLPPAFYKISSKKLYPQDFRKECDRYMERLEKKSKIILNIKQRHNAFLVLRFSVAMNKKHRLALSLSSKVSRLCVKLNARIVNEIVAV